MPGFDGTGPRGQGAMTGGGRGYCALPIPDGVNRPVGRGAFYGRGGGRGWRNCFYATGVPGSMRGSRGMRAGGGRVLTPAEELSALRDQEKMLKEELDAVQTRARELGSAEEGK